tara:strand:- start:182 stop:322 length:141 start_codon:yes stop_codon:yes gene_type:complete
MGYKRLTPNEYETILTKVGKSYMPPEPKKPKFTIKQLFFFKKKFKK